MIATGGGHYGNGAMATRRKAHESGRRLIFIEHFASAGKQWACFCAGMLVGVMITMLLMAI